MGKCVRGDTPVFLNSYLIFPDRILSRQGSSCEGLVVGEWIGVSVSLEFELEVGRVH